jgi:hypothetical protein
MWSVFSPKGLFLSKPLDCARLIRFPKSNCFELLMDFRGKRLGDFFRIATLSRLAWLSLFSLRRSKGKLPMPVRSGVMSVEKEALCSSHTMQAVLSWSIARQRGQLLLRRGSTPIRHWAQSTRETDSHDNIGRDDESRDSSLPQRR